VQAPCELVVSEALKHDALAGGPVPGLLEAVVTLGFDGPLDSRGTSTDFNFFSHVADESRKKAEKCSYSK
jgi:hypothetical protein